MKTVRDGAKTTLFAKGRIDANHAQHFSSVLEKALEGTSEFVLDFSGVEYISSSGLRAIMRAVKTMDRQGSMRIVNVSDEMYDLLEMTSFTGITEIERAK